MNRRKFISATGVASVGLFSLSAFSRPTMATSLEITNVPNLPDEWIDPEINIMFDEFIVETKKVNTSESLTLRVYSGIDKDFSLVTTITNINLTDSTGSKDISGDIGYIDITDSDNINIPDKDLVPDENIDIDLYFELECGDISTETDVQTITINIVDTEYSYIHDLSSLIVQREDTEDVIKEDELIINGQDFNSYEYTSKSGDIVVSDFDSSNWFTETEDTVASFIGINGNLDIRENVTFSPTKRKLFTVLHVSENLNIDGIISMSGKGSNHSGNSESGFSEPFSPKDIPIINGTFSSVENPRIPELGGDGGNGFSTSSTSDTDGTDGIDGTEGGSGGGGSGGGRVGQSGGSLSIGSGAQGTAFAGGASSGAGLVTAGTSGPNSSTVEDAEKYGGSGSDADAGGNNDELIGGIGNLNGDGENGAESKDSGVGGTLIIFVDGEITGNGRIESEGIKPNPTLEEGSGRGAPGSSGGGSITVISESMADSITLSSKGGDKYDVGNVTGGAGGDGSARFLQK